MTHVSAATLESCLTNMRLKKMWTKTVLMFVTAVLHLMCDHKEAMQGIHADDCHIEKLNATFFEHKDMAAHVETVDFTLIRFLSRLVTSKNNESQKIFSVNVIFRSE